MLIRDIGSDRAYHVPIESARKFIAAGLAVSAEPTPPKYPRNMKFVLIVADDNISPIIRYSCGCGAFGIMSGPLAHKTQKIGHCGIQEGPSAAVVAQYEARLKRKAAWIDRNRKLENKGKLEALRSRP
jgi:hypothetical protein